LKSDDVLKLIEESYKNAPPATFPSVQAAVDIAGAALRYLTDQCEDEDEPEAEAAD
jgi:hypothetical protein